MLKPEKRLQWKVAPGAKPAPAPPSLAAKLPEKPRPKGMPSNAMTQSQFTLAQVQKIATSRGISVEKVLAQMVQQYLKESQEEGAE
jgi:hypothetical protein